MVGRGGGGKEMYGDDFCSPYYYLDKNACYIYNIHATEEQKNKNTCTRLRQGVGTAFLRKKSWGVGWFAGNIGIVVGRDRCSWFEV